MKKVYIVMYLDYSSRRDVIGSVWENSNDAEKEIERLKAECMKDEFGELNYLFYVRTYKLK